MSKQDLLTKEEDAAAQSQGWSLGHVYDLASKKWSVQVYGMPSCEKAGAFVVNQARMGCEKAGQSVVGMARMGNPLAIKALRLIQESHTQGTT